MQNVLLENKVALFYSIQVLWYDYRLQLHLSGHASDTFSCFASAASIAESRYVMQAFMHSGIEK